MISCILIGNACIIKLVKDSMSFTKTRREIMQSIKGKGNKSTELRLAKIFRGHGITGWRRHLPLPGKPDFAFPKAKVAIFVDGCFWHGCPKCYREPATNTAFWKNKVLTNKSRDRRVSRELRKKGWKVLRLWECKLKDANLFLIRLRKLLT